MYLYLQRTGEWIRGKAVIARGDSGFGRGENNPDAQHEVGVGPIPQGAYLIGKARDSATLGPVVLPLDPLPGTETFGRTGFYIHGYSVSHPGSSSHGCINLDRQTRELIAVGHDRLLVVLSGDDVNVA